MALYNNSSEAMTTLRQSGIQKALAGGVRGIAMGIGGTLAKAVGAGSSLLGKTAVSYGATAATNAVRNIMNKHIPMQQQRALAVGSGAIGDILAGDWEGAGMRVLESGLIDDLLPGMAGIASQVAYWNKPNAMFGGLTPTKAREIIEEMQQTKFARTNLFMIEVSSATGAEISFNMFATGVEITPNAVTAEKVKIGGAVVDIVQSTEAAELTITTLDDTRGTLKRWFELHCAIAAGKDGCVGLPSEYAVEVNILHAYLSSEVSGAGGGYRNRGTFRPNSLELTLSRRETDLQELRMSFSQLDTFM